ncbi:hypothetical protein B0H11DRAFT_2048583 [Mycena galericulata]|nr:hypothetical protein B0H11DRAFT_2048583 [Mycena galericulata]
MLGLLRSRPFLRLARPPILRQWHVTRIRSIHRFPPAVIRLNRLQTRRYSDAQTRIEDEGLPLPQSGPTTAALLAYAEAQWPPPSVIPAGWSADWGTFDYLLTLFAFSPYFLRLPQIEMLVNVKYAVPGEVRPLMYSAAREELVFQIDMGVPPEEGLEAEKGAEAEEDTGGAQVLLLNCRTFELWAYDGVSSPTAPPETIDELALLIASAPAPDALPGMTRLSPDPDGEAALARILARDESVIPLLESDFLGYAPQPTTPEDELVNADEADAGRRTRLAETISTSAEYIRRAEEELRLQERDLVEASEGEGDSEAARALFEQDKVAHAEMRAAIDEAKVRLAELAEVWRANGGEERK